MNNVKMLYEKNKMIILPLFVSIFVYIFGLIYINNYSQNLFEYSTLNAKVIKIPKFNLPLLNGKVISDQDISKKKGLLIFWASWCPPCIDELTILKNSKIPEDWTIYTVSNEPNVEKLNEAVSKFNIQYPIILDKTLDILNITRFPTIYVNLGNGTIAGPIHSEDTDTILPEAKAIIENASFQPNKNQEFLKKIKRENKFRLIHFFGKIYSPLIFTVLLILLMKKLKSYELLLLILILKIIFEVLSLSHNMNMFTYTVKLPEYLQSSWDIFWEFTYGGTTWGILYLFGLSKIIIKNIDLFRK